MNTPIKTPPRRILPVLEKMKETYKIWQHILPHISKSHRQTIGVKIDSLLLNILDSTFIARYSSGAIKRELVAESLSKNDLAKFFLSLMWECEIIKDKQYIQISELLVEVGKMLSGWKDYLEKKNPSGFESFGENS